MDKHTLAREGALRTGTDNRLVFECAAFLFDMDGVLVDSHAVIERHWRVWARMNLLNEDSVAAFGIGRPTVDTVREFRPEVDVESEAERLEAEEGQDTEGLTAIPNALRLLDRIGKRDWAVVTSSSRQTAVTRLRAAELPIPHVLVCTGDTAREKPHPDGYLLASAKLRVPPSECVVIEDSLWGVRAGLAADARVIWLSDRSRDCTDSRAITVTNLEAVHIRLSRVGSEHGTRYSVAVSTE